MRSTIWLVPVLLSCAALPQAAAGQAPAASAAEAPRAYLAAEQLPDPRSYLPDPPAPGSPAFAADRAAYAAALSGKDTPAWKRAQAQISVRSPEVQGQILCAVGATLDPRPTSAFGRLMQRSGLTLSLASEQAKQTWKRERPYYGDKAAVLCDPDPSFGTQSPSYPSGHGAIGWMWGLILAEIAPDHAAQALAWGASVGNNRVACRVHYPSDIAAGRQLGAVVYARLQGDATFRADMQAAKSEFAAARASGESPVCATE